MEENQTKVENAKRERSSIGRTAAISAARPNQREESRTVSLEFVADGAPELLFFI